MKKLLLCLLSPALAMGQIFVESPTNGYITITPKGIKGKTISDTIKNNIVLGHNALQKNSTGIENVAIGNDALRDNVNGYMNVAIGHNTSAYNLSGTFNVAIGLYAMLYNQIGNYNTAVGTLTFTNNKTGNHNTAFGTRALWFNSSGNYNTAIGSSPLDHNDTGQYNFSAGAANMYNNVSGNNNTSAGAYGMQNAKSGNNNTSLGYQAGDSILTGNNNTLLGYKANSLGDYSNATALGANAIVDASNKIRFGDTNVTVVEGPVAYSYPSDRRLKENITYNTRLGLDFINRLQPVSYNYIADKTKLRHNGFIAQEVEQVMKDLNLPFSGLKKSDTGTYSLAYSDFVMPLVNAVKELNALNKNQQTQIDALSQNNKALTASIEEIKAELLKLRSSGNNIQSK